MRKGFFTKLSVGAALAAAIGFVPSAHADIDDSETMLDPAVTLIMPFDVTENKASFQIVSRIAGSPAGPVATHWSYWSESCDHLADVFICLTPKDTVVVDPTALQAQIQAGGENISTGPVVNLSGSKGFVTVTAFNFLEGSQACAVDDPSTASDEPSLVGSWTVANTVVSSAFGNNAIGLRSADTLPDISTVLSDVPSDPQGIFVQTFDPTSLEDSEVFFIGVAFPNGNGQFAESEIGPIPALLSNGRAVECDAEFCDNVENCTSINNLLMDCSTSFKIADNDALGNDPNSIIPARVAAETSGFVRLSNCFVGTATAGDTSIVNGVTDDGLPAFIFAFHGMAVGPYGTAVSAKYTLL